MVKLLAVISILSIILLIAIPIINNVISKSRKNAFKTSVLLTIDAADSYFKYNELESSEIKVIDMLVDKD